MERPTIELAGCRHLESNRCTLRAGAESTLDVWVDVQAQAPVHVTLDGMPIQPNRRAIDGGQRLRVVVPEHVERLRIEGLAPRWTEAFELVFERERIPAVVDESVELWRAGQTQAAIERLSAAERELAGVERLAALQRLRISLENVDPNEALRRAEDAAELARTLGRTRDFADCAAAASQIALQHGDLPRARRWTKELEHVAAELSEAKVWARYAAGVLGSRTGDLSTAVRALHEASRLANRLNMPYELLAIDEQRATALAELGRADEALQVAREILALSDDPAVNCHHRQRARGNVAWINLILAEAGHPHDSPRGLLEQQLAAVSEHGECPDPYSPVLVNLAIVALAEHEPEEAWAWILAQHELGVPSYLQPWVDEITAQVGVATGREELIPDVVRRPDPGGAEPSLRWMAMVRHAQTLDAMGWGAAAIDAYLEAEAVLEETFQSVGVDLGRELFLAGRRASSVGLVDLLVRQGDVEAAFCRARLARGRALRTVDRAARIAGLSPEDRARRDELLFGFLAMRDELALEQREDWKYSGPERAHREGRRAERIAEATQLLDEALRLVGGSSQISDCEQLAPIADGVVMLLQFPRIDGGSWIFVADQAGVNVAVAPEPDATQPWTAALLEPFAEQIAGAEQIRILPTGSGWSVAFHALPFGDGVLLDVAPVVYALDLPAREQQRSSQGAALVVGNASADLPHAEREADEVAQRLTASGWLVERQLRAEVSRARLTDALGDAKLFHYAGHGSRAGVDGWGAALRLHDGDRLGVSDILALPRVPDAVVLSGCETASVDHDALAGGMNLSRAFVLAGARWVVAADGKVDDDLAHAMSVAFYDELGVTDGFDGAAALRRAQLRLRKQEPDRWEAFRVVVP